MDNSNPNSQRGEEGDDAEMAASGWSWENIEAYANMRRSDTVTPPYGPSPPDTPDGSGLSASRGQDHIGALSKLVESDVRKVESQLRTDLSVHLSPESGRTSDAIPISPLSSIPTSASTIIPRDKLASLPISIPVGEGDDDQVGLASSGSVNDDVPQARLPPSIVAAEFSSPGEHHSFTSAGFTTTESSTHSFDPTSSPGVDTAVVPSNQHSPTCVPALPLAAASSKRDSSPMGAVTAVAPFVTDLTQSNPATPTPTPYDQPLAFPLDGSSQQPHQQSSSYPTLHFASPPTTPRSGQGPSASTSLPLPRSSTSATSSSRLSRSMPGQPPLYNPFKEKGKWHRGGAPFGGPEGGGKGRKDTVINFLYQCYQKVKKNWAISFISVSVLLAVLGVMTRDPFKSTGTNEEMADVFECAANMAVYPVV